MKGHVLSSTPPQAECAVYSRATEGQGGVREGSCSGQGQQLGIAVVGSKEGLIREGFLEEATECYVQ